jgi:hypothetical protein
MLITYLGALDFFFAKALSLLFSYSAHCFVGLLECTLLILIELLLLPELVTESGVLQLIEP